MEFNFDNNDVIQMINRIEFKGDLTTIYVYRSSHTTLKMTLNVPTDYLENPVKLTGFLSKKDTHWVFIVFGDNDSDEALLAKTRRLQQKMKEINNKGSYKSVAFHKPHKKITDAMIEKAKYQNPIQFFLFDEDDHAKITNKGLTKRLNMKRQKGSNSPFITWVMLF